MSAALVVSPHSDDAAISIGSTIYHAFDRCVILTPFSRSMANMLGVRHEVTALRKVEDAAVARAYGFRFEYADFPDTSIRGVKWDAPDAPVDAALLDALCGWLRERVAAHAEDAGDLVIFYPAAIGGHPDHRLCALAARRIVPRFAAALVYVEQPYAHEVGQPLGPHAQRRPFDSGFKRQMLRLYPSQLTDERVELLVRLGAEYVMPRGGAW